MTLPGSVPPRMKITAWAVCCKLPVFRRWTHNVYVRRADARRGKRIADAACACGPHRIVQIGSLTA